MSKKSKGMELERIAQVVNLGLVDYEQTYYLQEQLARLRGYGKIPDTILVAQHPLGINFGINPAKNLFSDELRAEICSAFGDQYTLEQAKEFLAARNILFSKTYRGGGATILAPGQIVYYPIVDVGHFAENASSRSDQFSCHKNYRHAIMNVLYDSIVHFAPDNVELATIGKNQIFKDDKTDIHYIQNGKRFKLASRGLRVSTFNNTVVGYHGFAIYAHECGVKDFYLVKPCGFDLNDVGVASLETATGKKISEKQLTDVVLNKFKQHFAYDRVISVSSSELSGLMKEQSKILHENARQLKSP